MTLRTRCVSFDALSPHELYAVLRLRAEVFVVEQECAYLDLDDLDQASSHLLAEDDEGLVGYLRWNDSDKGARIGRVVTALRTRGTGLGHELMRDALARIGSQAAWLHAQDHLRGYYGAHGFEPTGPVFDEDGIPHIKMVRPGDRAGDRAGERP